MALQRAARADCVCPRLPPLLRFFFESRERVRYLAVIVLGSPSKYKPWVKVGCVWFLLNLSINTTFPARTDHFTSWFLPCWEATLLLLMLAVWVAIRGKVPVWLRVGVVGVLVFARAFRLVDGTYLHFFSRPFRPALDVTSLPGIVKLLVVTDGWLLMLLQLIGVLVLFAAFAWLVRWSLLVLERQLRTLFFSNPKDGTTELDERSRKSSARITLAHLDRQVSGIRLRAGVSLAAAGLLPLPSALENDNLSIRLVSELRFFLDYPELKREIEARIRNESARLEGIADNLQHLRNRDVSVIVVESYGRGALETKAHRAKLDRTLSRFESGLRSKGRSVASRTLLAPSYGGGSWYAHATFATGVKVWSPVAYNLLLASDVKPLSRYMAKAGYATVHIMPGTTSVWPEGDFYGFQETLYARDFDYKGPWFNWGQFPDQFVLDQVRRRLPSGLKPIFKEIKLVSSHVPWRSVPSVLDDWDRVGDGAVYHEHPAKEFDIKWSNLKNAHGPYIASILYDLEVVGQYVERFEKANALVFVLGDHQPVRQAALSEKWDVPIHVSGPEDLVSRFVEQGFRRGIRPDFSESPLPMEDFLPFFLSTLSG